jgi:hypothetical protein
MQRLCSECGGHVHAAHFMCPVCNWVLCAVECAISQLARGHHTDCNEEHHASDPPPSTFATIKLVDSWLCL